MLGLIEKDLRLTLARKQTLLIFLIMVPVMGLSTNGYFVISYLTMLAVTTALGTIGYDESDNGLAFLMTLPFDRKTYVREKYLFSFIMAISAWCIGTILYFAGSIARHNAINLTGELPILIAFVPVLYLSAAIMIPLRLKYGSEKSRIVIFILFGFIAILIFGVRSIFSDSNHILAGMIEMIKNISPVIVLLVSVVVYSILTCVSYLWSVRIMEKKEF